jgi:L-threonylcarbamoyladenylate synthase
MQELLKVLRSDGIVIYPTETLYALGCDATSEKACDRVAEVKGRSEERPLPLIIGGLDMLDLVTAEKPRSLLDLAGAFWPGPLSILVKALPELPAWLSDEEGYTSVRWSGHPFASELSRRFRKPIVATSANLSGKPPAALPEDIDPELLEMVDGSYFDPPWPRGHKASTVVRMLGSSKLEVIREGEISIKKLCDKGFSVAVRNA